MLHQLPATGTGLREAGLTGGLAHTPLAFGVSRFPCWKRIAEIRRRASTRAIRPLTRADNEPPEPCGGPMGSPRAAGDPQAPYPSGTATQGVEKRGHQALWAPRCQPPSPKAAPWARTAPGARVCAFLIAALMNFL